MIQTTMVPSITDLNAYVAPVIAEYPSFSAENCKTLVSELNALQRIFFLRCAKQLCVIPAPLDDLYALSTLLDEFGVALSEQRLLCAFTENEYLPRVDYGEMLRTSRPCCAVLGDELHIRTTDGHSDHLWVLVLRCPPDITYANGSFSGSVYIPAEYLPLLNAKLRQTVCALAGEYEAADYWARAYNELFASLPTEDEEEQPRRKAL